MEAGEGAAGNLIEEVRRVPERERVEMVLLAQAPNGSWRPVASASEAILTEDGCEWSIDAYEVSLKDAGEPLLRETVAGCRGVKVRYADEYGLWEGAAFITCIEWLGGNMVSLTLAGSGEPQTFSIPWRMRKAHRSRGGKLLYWLGATPHMGYSGGGLVDGRSKGETAHKRHRGGGNPRHRQE